MSLVFPPAEVLRSEAGPAASRRVGRIPSGAPRAGDVIIERAAGSALCLFGLVRQDGLRPARLRLGTLSEATHWAEQMLAGTGGRVREIAAG